MKLTFRTRFRITAACVFTAFATSGCALLSYVEDRSGRGPKGELSEQDHAKADQYWSYAVLASQVYISRGEVQTDLNIALSSPLLKKEMVQSGDQEKIEKFMALDEKMLADYYEKKAMQKCGDQAKKVLESSNHAVMLYSNDCDAQQTELDVDQQKAREKEINRPVNKVPQVMADCDHNRREDVPVPLDVAETTEGWTRASEFGKYERTRGWSFFIPDLAIDVWRREIHAGQDERLFEYAIVYRGTVGGGGWASNVRVVASLTSMVWDQYHQALRSTRAIVNQILTLHSLSDYLMRRANGEKTKITFTAVGHSLGGGIAQYVHLRVPQISKAIAFNPSPVNGASLVPIEERPHVMEEKMKLYPSLDPNAASIFILQEHHEALSLIFPCGGDGPVWGSEGGPVVACHAVDLSHGHPFNQHDMARMACKLYLARSQSNTALRP